MRGLSVLIGLGVAGTAQTADARTPLPTIEVVQPERRVRLIDVRGPLQFGWGMSNLLGMPVYAIGFQADVSFVELSKSTWLHLSLGESALIGAFRREDRGGAARRPAMFGAELGGGLSRYAPGGPAFSIGVAAGPALGGGCAVLATGRLGDPRASRRLSFL